MSEVHNPEGKTLDLKVALFSSGNISSEPVSSHLSPLFKLSCPHSAGKRLGHRQQVTGNTIPPPLMIVRKTGISLLAKLATRGA